MKSETIILEPLLLGRTFLYPSHPTDADQMRQILSNNYDAFNKEKSSFSRKR